MNNDLVYLNHRACEERAAAVDCRHSAVREIHLELAQAYEFRVFMLKKLTAGPTDTSQLSIEDNLLRGKAGKASAASRRVRVDPPQKTFII